MAKEKKTTIGELEAELLEIRHQLYEANETIEAIRNGQVDSLVIHDDGREHLYTLKTADQIYRIFIEKMAEGAVILSKAGIILFGNSRFASLLQSPLTDLLGKPFRDFIFTEDGQEFGVAFDESWGTDQKRELSLQGEDGPITVQLSLSALLLDNEPVMSVILTDMTSQKTAQLELHRTNQLLEQTNKELEDSNHDLQQFASVASHDLQEPLRKINVLLSAIIDKNAGSLSPETINQIGRVMHAAGRMKNFVVDVLNYSRLSSDIIPFTASGLGEIVGDVLDDLELVIQDKNAVIEVGPLPVVRGNKGQLRQVIQNLLVNALKFTKPGQRPIVHITGTYISTRSVDAAPANQGPYARIAIRDEGIGFDQAFAEKIFSLFTRLHSKDRFEGTGIGLAIAKRVVEGHGGLIAARSRENLGTEFLIVLPAGSAA